MITCTADERKHIAEMPTSLKPSGTDHEHITHILEFCCDPDSEIGRQAELIPNVQVFRATEDSNVMTTQGLQRCVEYLTAHKDAHLWGSIPCTPWSQIQNLNIHLH